MQIQHLGPIEIHKVTELPGVPMRAGTLLPGVTDDMLADGRQWLPANFIHPEEEIVYLSFHSYVVKTPRHNILVDACCGNQKQRESMPAWHMLDTPYLAELAATGLRPEDIDIVLCTHLHADHVGWNTRLVDGRWVPTFPNARYIMAETEYQHLREQLRQHGPDVFHGCYADSVLPVVESGQAEMVSTSHRVGAGIY